MIHSRSSLKLLTGLAFALSALLADAGHAQVGEQARISTRSDVKMSIEGALGTGGARLDALAKHLGGPLGDVKACYAELVKDHPEVTGTLQVDLALPEKKGVDVALVGQENLNKKMRTCVEKAFKKITGDDVPRPAKARVMLELTNSAASAVQDVRERGEEASRVEVKAAPDGKFMSEGVATQGEVSYRVVAATKELVEEAHTAVRDTLPSLFDCRRRASKFGSPEGELVIDATMRTRGNAEVSVRSSTVSNARAAPCTDNALSQGLKNRSNGKVELTIRFAP
jgi:hypothetical protein